MERRAWNTIGELVLVPQLHEDAPCGTVQPYEALGNRNDIIFYLVVTTLVRLHLVPGFVSPIYIYTYMTVTTGNRVKMQAAWLRAITAMANRR